MTKRDFLSLSDLSTADLRAILAQAKAMKADKAAYAQKLAGKKLAMIFEKPSTRTRVSFEVGMLELGGHAIMLSSHDMQLGRGETVADTARVLSRYVDAAMIRAHEEATVTGFAKHATIPVVNGLTDMEHPCQVMADIMAIEEQLGDLEKLTIAWVGDGNNMASSWLTAATKFGFKFRVATPAHYAPEKYYQELPTIKPVEYVSSAAEAVQGAQVVMTDTWVSMGDVDEQARKEALQPYQVNSELMQQAMPGAIFLHCLPAHRGDEITNDVLDGPQSAVWDEAENRLHVQKSILCWCLGV